MRKVAKGAGYTAFFVISFLLFLVMTFDYSVLKETITSSISKSTGYHVSVGSLSPSFPIGFQASDVKVDKPGLSALKIERVSVNLSVLSLVTAKVGVLVRLVDKKNNYVDLDFYIPIFRLFSGNMIPSELAFEAKSFPLDDGVQFFMSSLANDPSTNPLLSPILSEVKFRGALDGKAEFDLDASDPSQSSGNMDIKLIGATLILSAPSLGLPDQKFNKALVKGSLEKGRLTIDNSAGFRSEELGLNMSGNVFLKQSLPLSTMNMRLVLNLSGALKDYLGIMLSALGAGADSDEVTIQLNGSLTSPQFKSF